MESTVYFAFSISVGDVFLCFCNFGPPTTRWGKFALRCRLSLLNEVKWEARCC